MTVTVKDNGYKTLFDNVPKVDGDVSVGVQGEQAAAQHPNSKLTVGELAAVHEFGLGRVPERAFVRGFVDDGQAKALAPAAQLARMLLRGLITQEEFRVRVGALLVEGMQKRMDDGIDPPLLAETINKKDGPPVPLEDTMTLRDAISAHWRGT
jgi:hypothetical protein